MMYEFMRHPLIWQGFCGTYEGVYDLMGQFDQFYNVSSNEQKYTSVTAQHWAFRRI